MREELEVEAVVLRCPVGGAMVSGTTGLRALKNEVLESRVVVLAEIADRYRELVDPARAGSGVPGSGEWVSLRPHGAGCALVSSSSSGRQCSCWFRTVTEFERLLGLMRSRGRQEAFGGFAVGTLRWHVLAWHVDATVVQRREPVMVRKGSRKRLVALRNADGSPAMRYSLVRLRDRDARRDRAELGLRWMALRWGLGVEPERPPLEVGR